MAYEVVMSYHLHMPSYFLGTFTEYPEEMKSRVHIAHAAYGIQRRTAYIAYFRHGLHRFRRNRNRKNQVNP